MTPPDETPARRRRFLAYVLAGLSPWVALVFPGRVDVFFAWGWINLDPWNAVTVYEYLFVYTRGPLALPRHIQAWPIATLLYAGAFASALAGVLFGREDRRLTAGLAALSMLSVLRFSAGFARPSITPVPIGVAVVALVVWWYDADLLTA
ncbi:TIGR04206 family protein [Natronoarchaeum philippinense]|uniref:TIGR04206 family protein n=1 Tax=Natronoarchaeum philippinense TaxID=558529 RepID=A0A285N7A8_NATPI|nr:TIGR04206 family protein [Natronoarchaeum philippinense]SNZ05208.1 TIGR04206 family protein [Natronoarchaeum philippinense]